VHVDGTDVCPQYSTYNAAQLFPPTETFKFMAVGTNSAAAAGLDFTVHSVGVGIASYAVPRMYTLTSDVAPVTRTLSVAQHGAPYTAVVEDERPPRLPLPASTADGWYFHKAAGDTSPAKANWYLARSGVRASLW